MEEYIFLKRKPKYLIIYLIFIIIFLFISSIYHNQSYVIYKYKGYFENGVLHLIVPTDEVINVLNSKSLTINNEKIKNQVLNISEIYIDQNTLVNYQQISIDSSVTYPDNLVLDIMAYGPKKRMFYQFLNYLK